MHTPHSTMHTVMHNACTRPTAPRRLTREHHHADDPLRLAHGAAAQEQVVGVEGVAPQEPHLQQQQPHHQ